MAPFPLSIIVTVCILIASHPQIVVSFHNVHVHPRIRGWDISHYRVTSTSTSLAGKGFGAGTAPKNKSKKKKLKNANPNKPAGAGFAKAAEPVRTTATTPSATPLSSPPPPITAVPTSQEKLLAQLAAAASVGCIGRAVSSSPLRPGDDPFWEMIPSLLSSMFAHVPDSELTRVAGFIRHTLDPSLALEDDIIADPWRPHHEIHAYMPGLGERTPFLDPSRIQLCQLMTQYYDTILLEYEALLADQTDRFQSVTSLNYKSGWKTMVLFYNGHRIPNFPYHLCPITTQILESVPIAGRIAGFNRQEPQSGIPLHSDGNNMWLTCQMGLKIPGGVAADQASIRVGPETKFWKERECLLYDTTYEHETVNRSKVEERVVLHVDFFNVLAMSEVEIEVLQYIYDMREKFMEAEGVAKVGTLGTVT